MVLKIKLTGDNTIVKEDVGFNMKLEIILNDIWEQIKQYDKIYVHSSVNIPVVIAGDKKIQQIVLRDNYQIASIDTSGQSIMVTQDGYYEGSYNNDEITVNCRIWRYQMQSIEEVAM